MKIFEYQLLIAGDMSGNVTSPSQQLTFMVACCIQAVFTGTPVGTLILQVSNDNTNWTTYTGSSATVNGAGNFAWLLADIGYPWIRIVYTAGSSTGLLNISVNGKGF